MQVLGNMPKKSWEDTFCCTLFCLTPSLQNMIRSK